MTDTDALSQLEELALDFVVADYQRVASIHEEVKLLFGNGVSSQQITAAFEELRDRRLVEAFVFNEHKGGFERFRRDKLKASLDIWWYATDEGRRQNRK